MAQNPDTKPDWAKLLVQAVSQPGIISSAYRLFHTFSVGNQILAATELTSRGLPLAPIASFRKWKELGRSVKKGEKAIALVMPVTVRKRQDDDEDEQDRDSITLFLLKRNWFSLDQTEGEEFQPEVKIPNWDADLALTALDIQRVPFDHIDGNCQGFATQRCVAVSPIAALPHKTLFHEIAHVVLGHTSEAQLTDSETTPRDIREVEAESVAFLLCATLDLPGLDESRGYIQAWLHGQAISDKSARRIFSAADNILKAGSKEPMLQGV